MGTTGTGAQGIYAGSLESASGKLSDPVMITSCKNAGYVALSADQKIIYTTTELADGSSGAAAYQLSSANVAKLINQQSTQGKNATHCALDRSGKNLFVVNYFSGNLVVLPLNSDGSLQPASTNFQHAGTGPNPTRQAGPHAHGVYPDWANRFVYVPDLGADKIFIYQWNAEKGLLIKNNPEATVQKPGDGPRHFVLHPQKNWAYVCNELSLTVTAFEVDSNRGDLKAIQTINTLPEGASSTGASAAEIFCTPNGKNLYVSNRGHDSIVVYAIGTDGRLTLVQHMLKVPAFPRAFGISPDGRWLICAGQKSGTLNAYRIDSETGQLTDTRQSVSIPSPASVVFFH